MNISRSSTRSFAFFGTLGLTFASVACSASSSSTPASNSGTGGANYNIGNGGTGNVYDPNHTSPTAGSGSGTESDVLQADGSLLLKGLVRDFHTDFPDMEPCTHDSQK